MPQRKKRFELRYSRKRDDFRQYGKYIYKQHFLDILASKCKEDIEEAKKRVSFRWGKYKYEPSEEYKQFVQKYKNNSQW